MSDFTERLNRTLDEISETVAGGIDLHDLPILVAKSMEVAEELGDVPGKEKAAFAHRFASDLVDRFLTESTPELVALVRAIDVPLLPEWAEQATIDPIILNYAPLVLRAAVKLMLPAMFKLVASAAKGKLQINRE